MIPGLRLFACLIHAVASSIAVDWTDCAVHQPPLCREQGVARVFTTSEIKARFVEFAAYEHGGSIHPELHDTKYLLGYWTF